MSKNSKLITAVSFLAGLVLYIGFRMLVSDTTGDAHVSPVSLVGAYPSGQWPVDSPESSVDGSISSRNGVARPIWDLGDSDNLVILQRAHPIYAQRVEFDRSVLAGLKVGDGFSMHIPQTARILSAIVVERVGNRHSETLLASAYVLEESYAVQITFSGDSIFGNIETPEGVFILEQQVGVLEGAAVIFGEKEIFQNLDYRESDAFPLEG